MAIRELKIINKKTNDADDNCIVADSRLLRLNLDPPCILTNLHTVTDNMVLTIFTPTNQEPWLKAV